MKGNSFLLAIHFASYDRMEIAIYVHKISISHDFLYIIVIRPGLEVTETPEP